MPDLQSLTSTTTKITESANKIIVPGEIEEFIENLVQNECVQAIEEASTNLFIEKCFEEEKEKATDEEENRVNETNFTEGDSTAEIAEDFDSKTFIEKIKYLIRQSDYFLNRYMWIIAIIWLLITALRWISYANISNISRVETKTKMESTFRSSDGRLLTRPAGPPVPFFPNYTRGIIDDLYYGNNAKPSELLQKSEISILMFYAPWSLHCQEAKKPFIDVATSFSFMPTVRFSAVNCFTKYGSCKRQFKLYSYPIIVGHVGNVQINYPGIPSTVGLFRFVKHIIDPADKISSISDLSKMFNEFQHLVVGYFPFKDNKPPPEYSTFIATAMKSAGFQLLESTRFVIIQNPSLASDLSLDSTNRIRILSKNKFETAETKINISTPFLLIKQTKSDDILEWAKEKISHLTDPVVEWLYLDMMESGGKSEILHSAISESNAAILFTTDYGSNIAQSNSLKIIRDAAKAYHSCNGTTATVSAPKLDTKKIEEAQNACRRMALDEEQILPCCQYIIKAGICSKIDFLIDLKEEGQSCSTMLNLIPLENVKKRCCFAPRSPTKTKALFAVNWEDQLNCEWYRLMKRTENFPQIKSHLQRSGNDFTPIQGLGCVSNETIKFFAACRTHSHHLLKKLNFDNDTKSINDKLVIISVERESMHLLDNHEINAENISKFLINFHDRKLQAVKMSDKSDKKVVDKNVQSFQKLNAYDFETLLATKRKHDSVVFFTGGLTHGPSAAISYVLHTVASYFSDFNDHIKFYINDASANDLPFQYSFDRLPAIVFIPPLQSSIGGARYPHNLPISVPNLLAFLLSRSQPELRWRIALSSCSTECIKRNRLELYRFLSVLDASIRKLRTTRSHLSRGGHAHDASIQAAYVRTALHRRILQRTAAVHLDNVLHLLASNENIKNIKNDEANEIIKQSLFIRWILYNHFGL